MKILISILIISLLCNTVSGQGRRRPMTFNRSSGYANFNELSGGYGLGGTSQTHSQYYYGFMTTHGYQINIYGLNVNRNIFGGLGTGALFFEQGFLVPLYADVRLIWNTGLVSPFVNGDGGFLFSFEDIDKKTMMSINGGGGIQFNISRNFSLVLGTGLRVQMTETGRRSFVNLKLGLGFMSS